MTARARWPFRIGTAGAACISALVIHACGGSSNSPDQASNASLQSPPVQHDTDRDDSDDADEGRGLRIKTLSNRADLISGGDAYVEIVLPKRQSATALRVQLNGRDVRSAFAVRADGRVLGVVTGLMDGENVLIASVGKSHAARLAITNHPIGGPVIAGLQTQPFVCATPTPEPSTLAPLTNASGLQTRAVDAQCNIATEFKLYYRTTTAGCRNVLPDPNPPAPAPTDACF